MENPIIKELQVLMAAATISEYCALHNCNDCVFKARSEFRPCPFMEEDSPSDWKEWLQRFNPNS